MSSQTVSPNVHVDDPPTTETPAEVAARVEIDPAPSSDELPFESPEFGVGGFLPHLDDPTDG